MQVNLYDRVTMKGQRRLHGVVMRLVCEETALVSWAIPRTQNRTIRLMHQDDLIPLHRPMGISI